MMIPNIAPYPIVMLGNLLAKMIYMTAIVIENPKWIMKLTQGTYCSENWYVKCVIFDGIPSCCNNS